MGISVEIVKNNNFLESIDYENSIDIETKKSKGVYYTPKIIVDYILENTLKKHNVVKNPYPKVLDISCGCGNFLLEAYDILYNLFEKNIYKLKDTYGEEYWQIDNIHNHIISNCIYGVDIDENAIEILKKSLINKSKNHKVDKLNIYITDGLKKPWKNKFDYIIGNPPYIGHKNLDKEYKKYLLENYSQVYKDKADVYFCFYKRIVDVLDKDGISSIITPRYFLESPSGKLLRKFMKDNTKIQEIVDFLGANIFRNIGIASCIMTFRKQGTNKFIDIYKIKNQNINIYEADSLKVMMDKENFEYFRLDERYLGDEWIIVNNYDKEFYDKIQRKCEYMLGDLVVSYQGIITGCDKAFILKEDDERLDKIDNTLIKNWVKNKNINKYIVKDSCYKLIYSNDIDKEENYESVIKECIGKYKKKLENRRECKKDIRKWYELQWGREKGLFERDKIMYPYKSTENRFAIDYKNNFSSADVYSFFLNDQYKNEFSHEYLVGVLNSSTYDKYFKLTAKKMSKNVYDYYPNKVMKIKIFKDDNYDKIETLSKSIIKILSDSKNNDIDLQKVENLKNQIDNLVNISLGL